MKDFNGNIVEWEKQGKYFVCWLNGSFWVTFKSVKSIYAALYKKFGNEN